MTSDQYQACPCGRGKKIKFCCGKNIHTELDKIGRAIEGQQFEAALQQLDKLIADDPQRECAWAVKSTMLLKTGRMDEALSTIDEFLKLSPGNPVALAELSVIKASKLGELDQSDEKLNAQVDEILNDAVSTLHTALENSDKHMSTQVFEAIGILGELLIESGHILAGREHLVFQYAISGGEVNLRGSQVLMRTSRSPELPVLIKQETTMPKPADWVNWKESYIAARDLALKGAWTTAADQIEELIKSHEPHIVLLRAHSTLRCRLPDPIAAAESLRALAASKDATLDEAAEAEALAQLLDTTPQGEMTEMIRVEYPIDSAEQVLEKLQSDRRAKTMAVDFSSLKPDKDQPPPKAGFTLLNREEPTKDDPLTIDNIPNVLCESLLFGKQTDRNARFELITTRTKLDQIDEIVRGILGDTITGDRSEEVLGESPVISETLSEQPHFPEHADLEFRTKFMADRQQEMILDRWPSMPNPTLDNKAPQEVADDPAYQRRLLGSILVMETSQRTDSGDIFDKLRAKLNLPKPQPGKLANAEEAVRVPLVRLERLNEKELPDEAVATCFVRAAQNGLGSAVIKFGEEVLARDGLKEDISRAEVYGRMSQYCTDTSKSIEYLQKAQDESKKVGASPAVWMISEFAARMMRGEIQVAQNILNQVQTHHLNEPGVPQLLMQTLQQFGIVGPDGRPTMPAGAPAGTPAAMGAPAAAAPASGGAGGGGGIWTPDGGSAPAAQGEPKEGGKIWMPGMD